MATALVKDEATLEQLRSESELAIADMRERFAGLDAKTSYTEVRDAIKCCRQVRTRAEKAKKQLNADALAWQRTVNSECKRIVEQVREIEEPLKESKAAVDDAEKKAKEAALRKAREEEDRRRREELEKINRERDELERQKRELAEEKAKLEASKRADPETPKPKPESVVKPVAPKAVSSDLPEHDREKIEEWLCICLGNAPEVSSDRGQHIVDELCDSMTDQKSLLAPRPVVQF